MSNVEVMISQIRPDLVICTETHVTDDILDSEISIPGFDILRCNSNSRRSAGVVVYTRIGLKVNTVGVYVQSNDCVIVFDVHNSSCRGRWYCLYHSPNSPHSSFLDWFENIFEDNNVNGMVTHVTGDFNINMHSNNQYPTYKNRLTRFCQNYSLKQCVKQHTRVTKDSSTTIDLHITNDKTAKINVIKEHPIADHFAIAMSKLTKRNDYEKIKIVDRSAFTIENFSRNLSMIIGTINPHQTNFQDLASEIHNAIEKIATDLTSERYIIPSYSKRWFTEELRQLRQTSNELHARAHFINDDNSWSAYRKAKNLYNKSLKKAKSNEIKNILIRYKNDSTKMWRELKKLYNQAPRSPDFVKFGGELTGNPYEIAQKFNKFFVSSIIELNESIPHTPLHLFPLENNINPWNNFNLVNEKDILEVLDTMKKKTGINNVNKETMKMVMSVCGQSIVDLFNESLISGDFPDVWKFTVVFPIPKLKDTNIADEFRPVNSACTIDKILQTLVKNQLENHLYDNKILTDVQSGFRGKHSCETSINLILIAWKEALLAGKKIIAVFLDLKRAFETVDRNILVRMLEHYGAGGNVIKWFQSWLTNRRQYTRFKEEISTSNDIHIGIPQGTPLSCILFIIYINEIPKHIKHCQINLFADDTLIWVESENIARANQLIIEDLARVSNFLKMMKLKLNTDKTKFMSIGFNGSDHNVQVVIDNCAIDETNVIKYLGVLIDKNLTFNDNIDYLVKKISKKIAFLSRSKNKMDIETRLLFYKTIISPHFDYCSTVLLLANDSQIDRLQKLQNWALRIILNADRRTHIHAMLSKLSLLDIKQRVYFNVLITVFKAVHNLLPPYLSQHFKFTGEIQPYNLRGNNRLRQPNYKTASSQNSFLYKGAGVYNELIGQKFKGKVSIGLPEYKREVEKYVKEKYSSHRVIEI